MDQAENSETKFENFKLAHEYAWKWFEYHAGQRMNVFRFYFVIIAILSVGFFRSLEEQRHYLSLVISCLCIAITFLFWRADIRSWQLIKIAEGYLKNSEKAIATALQDAGEMGSIMLTAKADDKDLIIGPAIGAKRFRSFKQIIGSVYALVGSIAVVAAVLSGKTLLCSKVAHVGGEAQVQSSEPAKK